MNEWISGLSSENLSDDNYIQTDKYLETSLNNCLHIQFFIELDSWIEGFAYHKPAQLALLN